MDPVAGAMGVLSSKVLKLLGKEYNLQASVEGEVLLLSKELESMHTALCMVAQVPPDKLNLQAKLWARDVREASYDMEDILDTFLVRVDGGSKPADDPDTVWRQVSSKMAKLLDPRKLKARRDVAIEIKRIKKELEHMVARHTKYRRIEHLVANSAAPASVDPRLKALYNSASDLVGIEEPRDTLIEMMSLGEDTNEKMKIVSIFGPGGLGKTTLAKAAYDKVKLNFNCCAFVQVGQNPCPKKVLRDILVGLTNDEKRKGTNEHDEKIRYRGADLLGFEAEGLISELREFLEGKRYFIVVDDIWDIGTWDIIKLAFVDSYHGCRVVTTSRNYEVSNKITNRVYRMNGLSTANSKELFYARICCKEGGTDHDTCNIADQIIKKCHGVPLAIIAVASALATKPRNEWPDAYKSIGFGHGDSTEASDMKKILSFSYYDLPFHLRACMLYLSSFPEDYTIQKNILIWRWVAEGFIQTQNGEGPFEVGDGYFHELINRGLILPCEEQGILDGCHVHDMILHLIRELSSEENFIFVLDSQQQSLSLPEAKVRRIAFQSTLLSMLHRFGIQVDDMCMPQARSFSAFFWPLPLLPPVDRFQYLRVLALKYCAPQGVRYFKHIGKLLHLRYLGLEGSVGAELPEEVGRLQFLQTLILERTWIEELPTSLRQLTNLMCLRADKRTRVPDWIGKLTSLVELKMYPGAEDKFFMKELGKLTDLRVLNTQIILQDEEQARDLLESLRNLKKIEIISIPVMVPAKWFELNDAFVQPSHVLGCNLRKLEIGALMFPRLPASINPQALPNLYSMEILLVELNQQDVEIIGRFQKLCYLYLAVRSPRSSTGISIGDGFQNLKSFHALFYPPKFLKGAMPNLEFIELLIPLRSVTVNIDDLDLFSGLGNLSSLQQSKVLIFCAECCPVEVEEMEDLVRHAVDIHPNRPSLDIRRSSEDEMVNDSGLLGPQERKGRRLWGRIVGQLNLYKAMRLEAEELDELKTDVYLRDAKHKVRCFLGQLKSTRGRAWNERPPFPSDMPDRDLNTVMEHNASLERVLEMLTTEYPLLKATLEELKTAFTLLTEDDGTNNIAHSVSEEKVAEEEKVVSGTTLPEGEEGEGNMIVESRIRRTISYIILFIVLLLALLAARNFA